MTEVEAGPGRKPESLAADLDPPARSGDVVALPHRHLSVLLPLRAQAPTPGWIRTAVRADQARVFRGRDRARAIHAEQ